MKRILSAFLLFSVLVLNALVAPAFAATNYEEIYEAQQPANFEYMFGLDPYQAEEYTKYIVAPYPLFRTAVPFRFKNILIPPGYYLLTPREKDGKDYVLFKDNGRVRYIIPAYKTGFVDPLFYDKYIPVPKKTKTQKLGDWGNAQLAKMFKKSLREAPPKSYIDVNEIGNTYWEVILFYGFKQYHMLFKREG